MESREVMKTEGTWAGCGDGLKTVVWGAGYGEGHMSGGGEGPLTRQGPRRERMDSLSLGSPSSSHGPAQGPSGGPSAVPITPTGLQTSTLIITSATSPPTPQRRGRERGTIRQQGDHDVATVTVILYYFCQLPFLVSSFGRKR